MAKKDINQMTPQELEEYVNSLPKEAPPKWSSVGWLAGMGAFGSLATLLQFNSGNSNGWILLVLSILCWVGVGWLIYKILTFKPGG